MSTASELFLNFTTKLYSCLVKYDAIVYISWQEGRIATGIPMIPLSSLPVGSKPQVCLTTGCLLSIP